AKKLGLEDAPCIILDGLTEAQKKAYVIADNQLPMNAEWDLDKLKLEIENLEELDFDISLLGFDDDFLDGLMFDEIEEDLKDEDNPYTDKVEGLYYEPSDELVKSSDTYDESKVKELLTKIELSDVTSAEKRLLTVAATRHYEFNYSKIADLYASSNEEMQELMEQSALIIVDYDKAIKNGYAKLKTAIKEDYEKSL
ncbi:MAG TPA: hypothetical protein VMV86_03350, partial [Methanosarcinales archaeon]|nr:hypothetical protein [Methanosarcinales archaeon]